ncbi:putative bifunctional diguanylate cyclase/phosphodiesterase [Streptomyces sp. 6N223]|uniref:putative bifunctional diguanylate cyclase/phosphodiesterase n=1 Tax=Streptomyces sp. 6N223 TaxID=3457412 RepID=UPI003FD5DB8C
MNGTPHPPGQDPGGPHDTTPQKTTESNDRRGEASDDPADYRAAFAIAQLPMALVSRAGRILSANPALGLLLGVAPESLLGMRAETVAGLGLDDRTRGAYRAVLRGRSDRLRCTRRLKHADGHAVWAEITVLPTRTRAGARDAGARDAGGGDTEDGDGATGDPGGPAALVTILDISERRELREQLRHTQMHDPVTRLPNRALFFERLTAALADSATGRIGLCYLDLDGFKAVNDALGHRVGDELLAAAAQRLTQCATGAGGHLVARLGGDEFAVLVEGSTGTEQLTRLAEKLLGAVQQPFELAGQRLVVSASIGVVEREAKGTCPTGLMQAADTTLYWAKADGRARWTLFDHERNANRMTRQSLAATLRPAVERGEFTLEYQPIVGLSDELLCGAEALVRWRHPSFGLLSPDRFVPLAEETGAIVPLGRWILAEACRQARRWQLDHPGPPFFVSVNVAVRQVWDSDLTGDVARVLEETGLPAGLLQLELTESAVMCSAGRPLRVLRELAEMGVRIAIDDFGTGYSNLAYLSRLPVRVLKLDGTFVRGFRTARHLNPADETIVVWLVQLAHKLGLTVTAEGVEGPAQAERLRRIGCDAGQGWHYARPMAAERIGALLGASRAPAGSRSGGFAP